MGRYQVSCHGYRYTYRSLKLSKFKNNQREYKLNIFFKKSY